MTLRIVLKKKQGKKAADYSNVFACPIAKALLRKGILPIVTPGEWAGLLWGIIPVWGKIPANTDREALDISNSTTGSSYYCKHNLGLYNALFPCAMPMMLSVCMIYFICHMLKLLFS